MEQIKLGVNGEIEFSELLKHQQQLGDRIDNDVALRAASIAVAKLQEPAVNPTHQFAVISHKQQTQPTENPNNTKLEKRVRNDFEAVKVDDRLSGQDKEAAENKLKEDMKTQIEKASQRKAPETAAPGATPAWPPAVTKPAAK